MVDPRVSTAFMRRMMALWRAMFRIPRESVMTKMTGRPSGTMAYKDGDGDNELLDDHFFQVDAGFSVGDHEVE